MAAPLDEAMRDDFLPDVMEHECPQCGYVIVKEDDPEDVAVECPRCKAWLVLYDEDMEEVRQFIHDMAQTTQ